MYSLPSLEKYVPITLILVLVFMISTCKPEKGTGTIVKTVTIVDTLIVKHTIVDTLTIPYKVVEGIRDTLYRDIDFPINEYHYTIEDSLISGTIIVEAPFNPVLKYRLTSKTFNVTTKTEITKRDLRGFYYGGTITVEPLMSQLKINLAYQNRLGNQFILGYGWDFQHSNQLVTVGFLKRF